MLFQLIESCGPLFNKILNYYHEKYGCEIRKSIVEDIRNRYIPFFEVEEDHVRPRGSNPLDLNSPLSNGSSAPEGTNPVRPPYG